MNFDSSLSRQEKNIVKSQDLHELWIHKKESPKTYTTKPKITSPSVDIDTNITKEILEAFTGRFNIYIIGDASEKIINHTNKKKLLDDILTKGVHDKNKVLRNLIDGMMGFRLDKKLEYKPAIKEVISHLSNLLKRDSELTPTPKDFEKMEIIRKWCTSTNIEKTKKSPKEIEQDVINYIKHFNPEKTNSLLYEISRKNFNLIIKAIKTGKVGNNDVNVSTIVISTTNTTKMLKSGYVYEEDIGMKGERKRDLYEANNEMLEGQTCHIRPLLKQDKRSQKEKITNFFERAKNEPIDYTKDGLLNISQEDFNLASEYIRKGALGYKSSFWIMSRLMENKSRLEDIGELGTRKRDLYESCSDYVETMKKQFPSL